MKIQTNRVPLLVWILPLVVVAGLAPFHAKTSAAQKGPPTSYYTHGRIYTNDPEHPWAEAMAVSEGRISCIGKMDHVLTDCGGGQERLPDLAIAQCESDDGCKGGSLGEISKLALTPALSHPMGEGEQSFAPNISDVEW